MKNGGKMETNTTAISETRYAWTLDTLPGWARDDIAYLHQIGALEGAEDEKLTISYSELRMLVVFARMFRKLSK